MTRIPTVKISDKLSKINDSLTVNLYENGFMVDVSGRDDDDDWKSTKIVANTIDDLIELIREASEMPRID